MCGRYKRNAYDGVMQSLHANAITQGLADLVRGQRVVAIMGGDALGRDNAVYRAVAALSLRLARAGLLVASGGGPGAMEATHPGALHARAQDGALDEALAIFAVVPAFPANAGTLVARDGTVDPASAVMDYVRIYGCPGLGVGSRRGGAQAPHRPGAW